MADCRVVNASPLITLAKVGQLGLLEEPECALVIPAPVADPAGPDPVARPAHRIVEDQVERHPAQLAACRLAVGKVRSLRLTWNR
jgi:hypothetical protein